MINEWFNFDLEIKFLSEVKKIQNENAYIQDSVALISGQL